MWMPSTPGTPASIAARTASTRARDDVQIVADQRRQKPGGAEAPMRAADRGDRVDGRFGIEEHAAAAVDLRIEKSRQQQMAVEVVAHASRQRASSSATTSTMRPAVDQHRAAVDEACVDRARGR